MALIQRPARPFAHLLPDVAIQIRDKAVAFQRRNEGNRRHLGPVGPDPARQRLRPDDQAVHRAALGLQVEGDLVVGESILKF